ncbi:MAG TPA: hypothetical protein VK459_12835 [Polyangiaceae bacterium]|nr:hypothetical protein [Polyangiaceae bacterium]
MHALMGFIYGFLFSAALFVAAGSTTNHADPTEILRRLRKTTEFRLNGSHIDVDRWDLTHFPPVDDELTIVARGAAFTCANQHDKAPDLGISIRADIHISNFKELPLGKPIDVGGPSAPVVAELSAFALNGCLVWVGEAQGTISVDALDLGEDPAKSVLRGSFDLHTDTAMSQCASERPMPIKMRWSSFETMSQAMCVVFPESLASGAQD